MNCTFFLLKKYEEFSCFSLFGLKKQMLTCARMKEDCRLPMDKIIEVDGTFLMSSSDLAPFPHSKSFFSLCASKGLPISIIYKGSVRDTNQYSSKKKTFLLFLVQ
jgi:hypothetical protein